MKEFRRRVVERLHERIGDVISDESLEKSVQLSQVDSSKKRKGGDIAFPVFAYAKAVQKNPNAAASDLVSLVEEIPGVARVEAIGSFVNFFLNDEDVVRLVLEDVQQQGNTYGMSKIGEGKLVVVDYSAPNIGKPLHVGHIRSTILGDSIIRLLQCTGHRTFGINYLGDVGLHIGKIMYAFRTWGSQERLEVNPEEEILNLYIRFGKEAAADEGLAAKAKEELERIEAGDAQSKELLSFIHAMSMRAFDRVYSLLDVRFDEVSGQSHFSDFGKTILARGKERGVVVAAADGGWIVSLDEFKLPEKAVLRNDGTAIYSTQDIGAAVHRYERFAFDKCLYIVANEQELYFKQLFKVLEKLGYAWAEKCFHVSFGMINLEEGRMSTREGTIVFLEEVLQKAVGMARKITEEKNPELENIDGVARMVGIGAMKYMVLSVEYPKTIEFSWERALDFNGNSAPYIQYSYARAASILEKVGDVRCEVVPAHLSECVELGVVKKIGLFPSIVETAAVQLRPNIVANYAYELSSMFNTFYCAVHVKDAGERLPSKVALVRAYMTTVKNAMGLLGIELPERM